MSIKSEPKKEALGHEVDIYAFMDYRLYLKKVYDYLKNHKTHFSYRYFAKLAGFGGQSYLRMVMDGERGLTPESITKFIRVFKLNQKESAYFESLVFYNQARSEEERDRYHAQLMSLRLNKRDKESTIISIPKSKIPEVINLLQQNVQQIINALHSEKTNSHEIFEMYIQFFPITQTKEEKNSPLDIP